MTLSPFPLRGLLCAGLAALTLSPQAWAEERQRAPAVAPLPLYAQECASCHIAYPPGMLPAASWQRLMDGLPRHFGVDASLEPAAAKTLSAWLTAHGGSYRRVTTAPPQDRISQSPWFVREHREVAAATWSRPGIRSAANCGACHTQATQGDFHERNIRIPR